MEKKKLSLYHIIKPATNPKEKPAVLFMLHGYGSNEEDLFSFAPELPEDLFIISIRAPFHLMPYGYAWYEINFEAEAGKWSNDAQARDAIALVVQFIGEACKAYDLDEERVNLLGFSQGCILSYAIALSHPEYIKSVIALSGYINEALLSGDYTEKDHTKLRLYCSHGSEDMVIPADWARKAPKLLDRLGIVYTYEEFPVGHGVALENFHAFKNWLLQKY